MSQLISYAQNGEDIVLYRALHNVKRGFYIDVGAHDPSIDSVTKLFYERGWSGINIEPLKAVYDRLVLERPRDQNLNLALSDLAGELSFYRVGHTGLSTLNAGTAAEAEGSGYDVEETRIKVSTLADVCRQSQIQDFHFLKVDVEGAERQVLLGADFTAYRPWIIVVEATAPGTYERVDRCWSDLLEKAGYDPVLFDGLNLFLLAREHCDLRPSLLAPANVTDRFVPVQHHAALLRLDALQAGLADDRGSLADGSVEAMRGLITWHQAVARENLERETAERIEWNRSDAEAVVRRSMEHTIAWNRADAEAALLRSMEDTIAWNRADAEAQMRRSVENTIAWHRADAAELAFKSGSDLADGRLREAISREARGRQTAEDEAAALRRLRFEQAARFAAAEAEFHDARCRNDCEVAQLHGAYRELLAWQAGVRASRLWRLTRPLRVFVRAIQRLLGADRASNS